MGVAGHDDGRLQVAESHHVVPGVGVGGDVDHRVLDAGLVERTVGGVALDAGRLGVDGDAHRSSLSLLPDCCNCVVALPPLARRYRPGSNTAPDPTNGVQLGVEIPVLASTFGHPMNRSPWGPPTPQTLHLVSDTDGRHDMLRVTQVKFPGRKPARRKIATTVGVSQITLRRRWTQGTGNIGCIR